MYKSALIIDDDPISILVCETMLRKLSFVESVKSFKTGDEAMAYLRDHFEQKGDIPDFIFLDVQMPIMDGWEFLDAYQGMLLLAASEPHVVMLSASCNPNDKIRAETYPLVMAFLGKPITADALENLKTPTQL